jgi:lipopolysaccharide export system permease protein
MEFERYSMRVAQKPVVLDADRPSKALPTAMLLAQPNKDSRAELLQRVSAPITCLVLIMLAIPLGFVNPRAGASANLIIGLLIFFTYTNLTGLAEGSVRQGKVSFAMAWWPLHLFVALCVLVMFAWRLNVNHPWHPRTRWNAFKRGNAAAGAAKAAA